MKVGSVKVVLSVLLLVALAASVVAYVYSQTQAYSKKIPTVLVLRYPLGAQFGVYWDYECTNPVTDIDFGELPKPSIWLSMSKTIYIRNEQPSERIWVYWNSTLRDVTMQITDSWFMNGTVIEPNNVYWSSYYISIQANVAVGTYQWTLGIWAVY